MKEFNPPINTRANEDLFLILNNNKEWDKEAVKQDEHELTKRGVVNKEIIHSKYIYNKEQKLKKLRKANESLLPDLFLHPTRTMILIMFTWELKKDGYVRKAKEQFYIRIIVIAIIISLFLLTTNY